MAKADAPFDVAVIGIPNDDLGEEVKAIVQPVAMPDDDEQAAALEQRLIAYCRAHLADGTVEMGVTYGLVPGEEDAGYVLTCQAVPTTSTVNVDFDA